MPGAPDSRCSRCGAELGSAKMCTKCLLELATEPAGSEERHQESWLNALEDSETASGSYELLDELARGGMGVVYRARHRGLNRTVALKMILPHQLRSPAALERFRSEARAVAALDHPGILPIYEVGHLEGLPFFSMKLAQGGSLAEQIPAWRNRARDAARFIALVARAVHHAHERGILHRDLKPGNILLSEMGDPYVTDFGIAKWLDRESTLTVEISSLGTPHYIAPEQASGAKEKVGRAADVYSLGAILYELLTGRPPFTADTAVETLRLVIDAEPAAPRSLNDRIPRDLESICLKCLEKEPTSRYATARALAEDLERASAGEPILAPRQSIVRRFGRSAKQRPVVTALVALLVSAGIAGYYLAQLRPLTRSPAIGDKTVAVLRFEDRSRGNEAAYVAEGVQDEILTRLGKISDLKVVSLASTQHVATAPANLPELAAQFGVANVLEGSVQQADDQLRVNVRLVHAPTNAQLWAETYDRKTDDLLRLETDIAQAVADTLQAKLAGKQSRAVTAAQTESPVAHQLYLKGRYFWNKSTGDDIKRAIDYFTQAIQTDPNYARAYDGLADAYALLPFFTGAPPQDCAPKARAAAERAVELNGELAEAHVALANVMRTYDFDYEHAGNEFRRGLELDPNYAIGHWHYSWYLGALGRFDEAFAEIKRAIELDPLSLNINSDLGYFYLVNGRYEEAIEQLRRTLEMEPNYFYAHGNMGETLACMGNYAGAIAEYEKLRQITDDPFAFVLLIHAYASSGNKAEAQRLFDQLTEIAKHRYVESYGIAIAWLALDHRDEALRWLEKAYQERAGSDLALIRFDPLLAGLRGEPHFEALADKIVPNASKPPSFLQKSIAVLPFADLTAARDQEYLCDGISEQILDTLARTPKLRVIGRASSFAFKGQSLKLAEIARQLNVQQLVDGTVERSGDHLRIHAELVRADSGAVAWSQSYERELRDAASVQDEIARAIAASLRLDSAAPPSAQISHNSAAYDLYLRGLHYSSKSREEDLRKAVALFQQALDQEPSFAKAWTGIAKAWTWLEDEYVSPLQAAPIIKAAAEKALALDPNDAEALVYLAEAVRALNWDYKTEETELRHALQIDPNSAPAHMFLSLLLASTGDMNSRAPELQKARELDPLSPIVSTFTTQMYLALNRVDDALAEAERMNRLEPDFSYYDDSLAAVYREQGRFAEAIALYQKAESITHVPHAGLGISYARAGRRDEAQRVAERLIQLSKTRYISADQIAAIYAAMGRNDDAFRWLDKAVADHATPLEGLGVQVIFRPLHSDPRFPVLLRRIGLDPAKILAQR